jgi:REP element-mobilizing transposase RayT
MTLMSQTRWHITIGTYAGRLHGGLRDTVDRDHNTWGHDHVGDNARREGFERSRLSDRPIVLSEEQQIFIQSAIPALCIRGGWTFAECSAAPDHVHIVLDADEAIHGKRIRPLLKRWLTQSLNERWEGATRRSDGMTWWAEGGSNRAVRGHDYRSLVEDYVHDQRAGPTEKSPAQ